MVDNGATAAGPRWTGVVVTSGESFAEGPILFERRVVAHLAHDVFGLVVERTVATRPASLLLFDGIIVCRRSYKNNSQWSRAVIPT